MPKYNYTKGKEEPITFPTNIYTLEVLMSAIYHGLAAERSSCDSWKDSGDRGACYAHKVAPLEETLQEIKDVLNQYLPEDSNWDKPSYNGRQG